MKEERYVTFTPGANVTKMFFFITYEGTKEARVFVPYKYFLLSVNKAGAIYE
jgi:hypothetical protein